MKSLHFAVVVLGLAGCSGGGGSLSSSVPVVQDVGKERESSQVSRGGGSDLLYIGNVGNNSITVYAHDAKGNTAPLYAIAGPNTGIDKPGQLSEDAQGNLYVVNGSRFVSSSHPAVLVFARGASGNVVPLRKLAVYPGLVNVQAMTVDQTTGKMFVIEDDGKYPGGSSDTTVLRYAADAAGNATPQAHATTDLAQATLQLASDSTGKNLIDAHITNTEDNANEGVETLVKQFSTKTGTVMSPYSISSLYVAGVADDPTTRSYLTIASGVGIYRFAEATVGTGPAEGQPISFTPQAISLITSDICGTQLAVAPGPIPYTYVTHSMAFGGCKTDAVFVYANNATGNAPPLRVLGGPATQLNEPYGIFEGQ